MGFRPTAPGRWQFCYLCQASGPTCRDWIGSSGSCRWLGRGARSPPGRSEKRRRREKYGTKDDNCTTTTTSHGCPHTTENYNIPRGAKRSYWPSTGLISRQKPPIGIGGPWRTCKGALISSRGGGGGPWNCQQPEGYSAPNPRREAQRCATHSLNS